MFLTLRFMFLSILVCPLVCARCSRDLEAKRTRKIFQKLCNLGEMRPVRCQNVAENMKIRSPKFPKQEESRLLVLKMSFGNVSVLLKNTPTDWKSSELNQLKNLLSFQDKSYTECVQVASPVHAEVEEWSTFWSSLTAFLSENSFSSCAWESARTVILQGALFTLQLASNRSERMFLTLRFMFLCILMCPLVCARCSRDLEAKRTRKIIQKLCNLGKMRPERCKTEAENMKVQIKRFPKQEESRLLVLKMSFGNVSVLLKNTPTDWKSSELNQLKNLLKMQDESYTECIQKRNWISSSAHSEVEQWRAFWCSLTAFLSDKSFSSCAWESTRTVILQVMRSFYKSTTKSQRSLKSC